MLKEPQKGTEGKINSGLLLVPLVLFCGFSFWLTCVVGLQSFTGSGCPVRIAMQLQE